MKQHSEGLKNELKNMGRELDSVITYNDVTLREELYAVTPHFEANILKSVMKQLDVESSVDIPLNTVINYRLGILVNGEYEYLNYGNYVVYKSEKQEDKDLYKITCFDKMLYSMKKNESLNIQYPITIKNYLIALANKIGLQVEDTDFYNQSMQIPSELYLDLDYTYRDILDEIAQATGSIIHINVNDKIEVKYPTDTGDTIDEEYLKDVNVEFGKKYGKINSIVLSRAGESDNVYLRDEESVLVNGLCEVKIVENQIMNFNNRSDYLEGILNALNGLEYYINDFSSTGILYYEVGDMYNIIVRDKTYKCIMLNDEINVKQGIQEIIHTDMPEQGQTDYTKADKTDRRINETYLIVDKQNQRIDAVITNVDKQNSKISQITQTVDEINSKIQNISDITVYGESSSAVVRLENVNESEPIQIKVHPTSVNISYLYPRDNLYPEDTLYMPDRIIRFRRTYEEDGVTKTEDVDYELPDDLLIYDSDTYDEFYLDYDSQTCQVTKRCAYNADGTVRKLDNEIIQDYEYPTIQLGTGDYEVFLSGYDYGYIYTRLMASNIYTTQFATKVELSSAINQTATQIDLNVNQKLSAYSTTTQMNSAITLKANEINQTVSTKVGKNEIISSINQTSEQVTIQANKINLNGAVTANNYFKINTDGSIEATAGKIGGFIIQSNKLYNGKSSLTASSNGVYIGTDGISLGTGSTFKVTNTGALTATSGSIGGFNISTNKIYNTKSSLTASTNGVYIGTDGISLGSGSTFKVTNNGALTATNATISGKITATSGNIGGCIIENGTLKIDNANINTINGSKIINSTIPDAKISSVAPGKFLSGTVGVSNFVIETSSGYIKCGTGVTHPYVSALNIGYGGGSLSFRSGTTVSSVGSQIGNIFMDTSGGENVMYISANGGINIGNGTLKVLPGERIQTTATKAGKIWIGDNVLNHESGSQIDMNYTLNLWSAQGYRVKANGTQIGGSNSTMNIKQNIEERDISDVLGILEQIKIYDYNYIPEFYSGEKSYGYIIDYLEKIPNFDKYVKFAEVNTNSKYSTKVVENEEQWIKFLLACVIELNRIVKKEK